MSYQIMVSKDIISTKSHCVSPPPLPATPRTPWATPDLETTVTTTHPCPSTKAGRSLSEQRRDGLPGSYVPRPDALQHPVLPPFPFHQHLNPSKHQRLPLQPSAQEPA